MVLRSGFEHMTVPYALLYQLCDVMLTIPILFVLL
jgi:hypothetical protein